MDRLQTHAWQLLALLLAALLVWQSLARLGAERDAAQARTDLATDRQAAATAALHASERYRQREGAYRERLDFLARDTDLALARAAAACVPTCCAAPSMPCWQARATTRW